MASKMPSGPQGGFWEEQACDEEKARGKNKVLHDVHRIRQGIIFVTNGCIGNLKIGFLGSNSWPGAFYVPRPATTWYRETLRFSFFVSAILAQESTY